MPKEQELSPSDLADILFETTELKCAEKVVKLVDVYQQKPGDDAEIAEIERSLDPLGIIRVDARTVRKLLDALSDSKREVGEADQRANECLAKLTMTQAELLAATNERDANGQELSRVQAQILTVTNERDGERKRLATLSERVCDMRDAVDSIQWRNAVNIFVRMIDTVAGEAPADGAPKQADCGDVRQRCVRIEGQLSIAQQELRRAMDIAQDLTDLFSGSVSVDRSKPTAPAAALGYGTTKPEAGSTRSAS